MVIIEKYPLAILLLKQEEPRTDIFLNYENIVLEMSIRIENLFDFIL